MEAQTPKWRPRYLKEDQEVLEILNVEVVIDSDICV